MSRKNRKHTKPQASKRTPPSVAQMLVLAITAKRGKNVAKTAWQEEYTS